MNPYPKGKEHIAVSLRYGISFTARLRRKRRSGVWIQMTLTSGVLMVRERQLLRSGPEQSRLSGATIVGEQQLHGSCQEDALSVWP